MILYSNKEDIPMGILKYFVTISKLIIFAANFNSPDEEYI